jgi:ribosomal protein RSM22 (predicted rRNA methylase)
MDEADRYPGIPPGGRHSIVLPAELERAIERQLATIPAAQWTREARALSERYRASRTGQEQPFATGPVQALAYLALIFPASYAQLRGAMAAAHARVPGWQPTTLLDLGSGPGTALWAAAAQWPSLRASVALEREQALVKVGRELAQASNITTVRTTRWERLDLRKLDEVTPGRHDLVILGHVLNELPPELRSRVVEAAWRLTAGMLLIVEPGTSAAFEVVRAARDQLLALEARTIAPCAHDQSCPLANDWCHFPQRLTRPEFQRRARGAPSQWEDSKFSYAAMARFGPEGPIWGRVINEPSSNKAYAEVMISTQEHVRFYRALKRHRPAFRRVQDLRWGEALAETPDETIVPVVPRATTKE